MTEFDLVILGAGPAGMAAAAEASAQNVSVAIVDEQPAVGGQIYRNIEKADSARKAILGQDYASGESLAKATRSSGAEHFASATVWDVQHVEGGGAIVTYSVGGHTRRIKARALLVATGATERPMPIPGWTKPRVITAGAAQIALKSSGIVAENAILAGTGPLLYLLAAQMADAGSPPKAIVEIQSRNTVGSALRHFGGLLRGYRALLKGLGLMWKLKRAGVKRYVGAKDLKITGAAEATGVSFALGGGLQELSGDAVLLHAGVVPNTQITRLLELEHRWDDAQHCFAPIKDEWLESSSKGIFVAGDGAGIGGAKAAEYEGRIAAHGVLAYLGVMQAADKAARVTDWRAALAGEMALRPFLDAVYAPPAWVRQPENATIVCRCEEITAGDIREYAGKGCIGPNQTKAFGRSGMGPCQGRFCGLTVTNLLVEAHGRTPDEVGGYSVRAPLKPVTLAELASISED